MISRKIQKIKLQVNYTSVAFTSFVLLYLLFSSLTRTGFYLPVLVGSVGQWGREFVFVENLYLFLHFTA